MRDGRHDNPGQPRLLEAADEAALEQALSESPEDGGLWSGPKVARWMSARLGRQVRPVLAAQERFQAGTAPSPR